VTGRERVLAHLAGGPVDHLPLMPITMMFAGDRAGIPYGEYCRDYRRLVEAQMQTAEAFGFDYVSCISDPAREAADCGAALAWFDDQPPAIVEEQARLADKAGLARLELPDPHGGGRMTDRIRAAALFRYGRKTQLPSLICRHLQQPRGFMLDHFVRSATSVTLAAF